MLWIVRDEWVSCIFRLCHAMLMACWTRWEKAPFLFEASAALAFDQFIVTSLFDGTKNNYSPLFQCVTSIRNCIYSWLYRMMELSYPAWNNFLSDARYHVAHYLGVTVVSICQSCCCDIVSWVKLRKWAPLIAELTVRRSMVINIFLPSILIA